MKLPRKNSIQDHVSFRQLIASVSESLLSQYQAAAAERALLARAASSRGGKQLNLADLWLAADAEVDAIQGYAIDLAEKGTLQDSVQARQRLLAIVSDGDSAIAEFLGRNESEKCQVMRQYLTAAVSLAHLVLASLVQLPVGKAA